MPRSPSDADTRRITAASRQRKPRMRACLGAVVLAASPCKPAEAVLLVAVTHATRRSSLRRILLALRDAYYYARTLCIAAGRTTPPLQHNEQPIKASAARHRLRERLPLTKQWKESNATAREGTFAENRSWV